MACLAILWAQGAALRSPATPSPDKPYFQQRVDYQIKVTLDPKQALLHGHLRLMYENRSMDTLRGLYMHLWPNAYRDRGSAYARQSRRQGSQKFHFAKRETRGFIDSLRFTIEGEVVVPQPATEGPAPAPGYSRALLRHTPDVVWLPLPRPLVPGGKVTIETPFRVKVPPTFSRLGCEGPQFQVTQWYPKPAVYDRKGWHPLPYLDEGEFYSEWGKYEVEIVVPSTYVVGATGVLETASEVAWLRERETQTQAWLTAGGPKPQWDISLSAPPKTLRFVQDSVHDFAWFADPRYAVLADTILLPNGHRVACVALFRPACAKSWQKAPQYIAEAVEKLSTWVGPYPYTHATAVEGALLAGGGMEYPMITVIAGCDIDTGSLRTVVLHEVGHNWFQGLLASNERLHPWQDEGINTYYENRLKRPGSLDADTGGAPQTATQVRTARQRVRVGLPSDEATITSALSLVLYHWNLDQPLSLSSEFYSIFNYGLGVYQRAGTLMEALANCVGESRFDKAMQAYFRTWAFRHPYPEDWVAIMEKEELPGQSWLQALYGDREPDFRLRVRPLGGDRYALRVEEPRGFWQGLCLQAQVWGKNSKPLAKYTVRVGEWDTFSVPAETRRLVLNPEQTLFERRLGNNFYYTRGFFPTVQRVRFHASPVRFSTIGKVQVGLTPLLGYNFRDGLMAGLLINHGLVPKRFVEFHLFPMYSFLRQTLRGSGGLTLRVFPSYPWYLGEARFRVMAFSGLLRTKLSIEAHRQAPYDRLGWHHTLRARAYQLAFETEDGRYTWENQARPAYVAVDWEARREEAILTLYTYVSAGHDLRGHIRTEVEGQLFWKAFRQWGLWARAYAGYLSGAAASYLYLRPSGFDPFGEKVLLDRFRLSAPRLLARQMPETQGGFRLPADTLLARSLLATNIELPIPGLSMLCVRADIGYLPEARQELVNLSVGLPVVRFRGRLAVGAYFPVWGDAFGPSRRPADLQDVFTRFVWHVEIPMNLRGSPIKVF